MYRSTWIHRCMSRYERGRCIQVEQCTTVRHYWDTFTKLLPRSHIANKIIISFTYLCLILSLFYENGETKFLLKFYNALARIINLPRISFINLKIILWTIVQEHVSFLVSFVNHTSYYSYINKTERVHSRISILFGFPLSNM